MRNTLEIEQEVLSTIFTNDEWRELFLHDLSEDDFQSPFYRAIFAQCRQNGAQPDAAAIFLSLSEDAKKAVADPVKRFGDIYLTLLGTSAEDADSGQVGRGNRVNGLISLQRPMGTEAAAGKNPVSHVGKIYNVLAHRLAREIGESVE